MQRFGALPKAGAPGPPSWIVTPELPPAAAAPPSWLMAPSGPPAEGPAGRPPSWLFDEDADAGPPPAGAPLLGPPPEGFPPLLGPPPEGFPPEGFPPGFGPMRDFSALPPLDLPDLPPLPLMGYPPGFGPTLSSFGPEFPGDPWGPVALGAAPLLGALPVGPVGPEPEVRPTPPPGPPPAGPPPERTKIWVPSNPAAEESGAKKRKLGVDGLAKGVKISSGGGVTVYNGYDAVTSGPRQAASSSAAPALAQQQAPPPTFGVAAGAAVQALPRQMPEGWEMRKSRSTGKVYYINEKLGKSQFDPPAGSTLQPRAATKKQRAPTHSKDLPDAQKTDKNGMMGVIRGSDKKVGRWQKWQQCARVLQEDVPKPQTDD